MTDRTSFIGGSDVAAILNLSPWLTKMKLWESKVLPLAGGVDAEKEKFFARRKRQEPVVAERLADEYGIVVTTLSMSDHPNYYHDDEHPFLAAEIDFEFAMSQSVRNNFPGRQDFCAIEDGTILNGEIKTVHPFNAGQWGELGSEEVPIYYATQVMHGLGVTKRPAAICAALFGIDNLSCYPIMRDEETIAMMREACVRFWLDYVVPKRRPEPSNMDDFNSLYKQYRGRPVELSDHARQSLVRMREIKGLIKDLEGELEVKQWDVARCVSMAWGVDLQEEEADVVSTENASLMFQGKELATWKRQRGSFLDQKRLKKEQPDLIGQYTVSHMVRVLRHKKG